MVHFPSGKFAVFNLPMHRFLVRSILNVFRIGFLAGLAACQSPLPGNDLRRPKASPIADASAAQQLIVKFKAAALHCNAADIAALAAQIDVRLEFVRPMSGNACVIRQLRGDSSDFSQGRKRLQQHPSIEWVEPDGVMKTM
jgi:hypothetical protein